MLRSTSGTSLRSGAAFLAAGLALVSTLCGCGSRVQSAAATDEPLGVLDLAAERIDGTPQPLEAYRGSVVLIVNTASECGFTPQYEGLEALWREHRDDGFVVLGFPSNDFLGQEPGTNEEIAAFCSQRFDVTFPMFAKVKVKGDDAHPLFARLGQAAGEPGWNFNKYLIDREGRVVARFGSRVAPDAAELRTKIDELL